MTLADVLTEILAMSRHGADKTRLKNYTKLNAYQLEKVLDFLVTYGFVNAKQISDGEKIFVVTEFGLKSLEEPSVSIVIPALNEAHNIESVVAKAQKYCDQIFLIDGNSIDGTPEIAKKLGISVITQKGIGKGTALRQGFDLVNGDVVITIDADGSMKPCEVPSYLEAIASGADVVKGSRFLPGGGSEDLSVIRRIGNLFFVFLVNLLWSTNYTDLCYGFAAIKKEALKKITRNLKSINFEIEAEICIKAKKLGLKVVEVPSIEAKREKGKSNLNTFRDGIQILKTILREFLTSFGSEKYDVKHG